MDGMIGWIYSTDGYQEVCSTSFLVSKHLLWRPLRRSRTRCEDNFKIQVRESGCEDENWI